VARSPEPVSPELLRGLPLPEPTGSKQSRGDVLVIGGARKTPGAVALTGLAALRVGAGRLTLAVAESAAVPLAVTLPEAGVLGLREGPSGTVLGASADALQDDAGAECVVLGPGLDDPDETTELLRRVIPLLGERTVLLLDAYGLGALGTHPDLVEPVRGRLVLTPNGTEAGFLLGREPGEAADDALEIADRFSAVVSMGGLVSAPGGLLREVQAGGPGLGTSGSGDVLAGAIAGLVARGAEPDVAATWGTALHSTAGDRLTERVGPLGLLARELIDELPRVLADLA
jgi:ADP-dependent NAD(P)H-hydrate dehydratase